MTTSDEPIVSAGVLPATRRILGMSSYGLGLLCVTAAGLGFAHAFGLTGEWVITLVVTLLVLVAAVALLVAAERFLVPGCREVCAQDSRPPVLFLRSFGEDEELTYDIISSGETSTEITAKAEDFLLALNAVGPLVSIGQPTRLAHLGLYPHGVFRDYVGHGQWQQRVQELLDQADMVVLTIGDTPGLEWEIVQTRERIGPESLLLYLPPRPVSALTRKGRERNEQAIYEHFRPMVKRHFDVDLPPFRQAVYVIGFDADRNPITADAPVKRWVWTEHGRIAAAITAQLKGVLRQTRPSVDLDHYGLPGRTAMYWRIALAVGLLVLGGVLGAVGFDSRGLPGLLVQALPGVVLIVGWILLARHFTRPWVWVIPALLGAITILGLGMSAALQLGWVQNPQSFLGWSNSARWLLNLVYAIAVLVLGVAVGRRR